MEWWLNVGFLPTEQMLPIARSAEECGFTGVVLSDHLVYPGQLDSKYPYSADGSVGWKPETPWPDPWVSIGAMAAVTERLRFSTAVLIAPLREPLALAKAIATASAFSSGRVELGLGTGWMKEEFEMLRLGFANRGARTDEMIEILRLLWSGEMVSYEGKDYAFPPVQMRPPSTGRIPILVGGHAKPALRRAARNDGWIGSYASPDTTRAEVNELRALKAAQGGGEFRILLLLLRRHLVDVAELAGMGVDGGILGVSRLTPSTDLDARMAAIREVAGQLDL